MDSLDQTSWDIIIAGTGLQESILALALSRSNKRILHVDKNDNYGGPEAALSLQDAEQWVKSTNNPLSSSYFSKAKIWSPTVDHEKGIPESPSPATLSFSRAYSLSLSPHILYCRSGLLPALVSAKVDGQLDFLILGSWWVYSELTDQQEMRNGPLLRVPSGREDLFADQTLDVKTKRALTKFLRFVADLESQEELIHRFGDTPFSEFLESQFKLEPSVQLPIHALSMSSMTSKNTTTAYAVPRVARHLRSIGLFGPGFGAVVPKWGGLAEVTQVACRACAVGGGVYNLGNAMKSVGENTVPLSSSGDETSSRSISVELEDGSRVTSDWIAAAEDNIPTSMLETKGREDGDKTDKVAARSIYVVSSNLSYLFPPVQEGASQPAGAVILFPASTLSQNFEESPVHIIVHNSDTGECPTGQSVLYANTAGDSQGFEKLDTAVKLLLDGVSESPSPEILWKMQYEQNKHSLQDSISLTVPGEIASKVLCFPPPSLDITFDDGVLERVEAIWRELTGSDPDSFLQFRPREGLDEEVE